jgi:hypothetical protein
VTDNLLYFVTKLISGNTAAPQAKVVELPVVVAAPHAKMVEPWTATVYARLVVDKIPTNLTDKPLVDGPTFVGDAPLLALELTFVADSFLIVVHEPMVG